MKKVFFSITFLFILANSQAQLGGLLNKVKNKIKSKTEEKKTEDAKDTSSVNQNDNKPGEPASIKAYSKYDFVPGEKIIVYEDFAQDAVGDFPDKWNTNSSAEIVTIESLQGKWLKISKQGVFMPGFIDSLPDNFTLEYHASTG